MLYISGSKKHAQPPRPTRKTSVGGGAGGVVEIATTEVTCAELAFPISAVDYSALKALWRAPL